MKMRIVFISDWFAEKMGYAENCLPKAVAALGCEVHLVTSNVQPYFDQPIYAETYAPFIGPGIVDVERRVIDGYTLHRLSYTRTLGRLRIRGLAEKLRALRPHIVQTFDAMSLSTYEAVWEKSHVGYRLFLESHLHASVFSPIAHSKGIGQRLRWRIYAPTIGRWVSAATDKCYPISVDAAEIASRYLGIQKHKIEICQLGVDTALFYPVADGEAEQSRQHLRQQLGFAPSDIVCIYTGRFAGDKGPLYLADAIGMLTRQGKSFRGLFVGNGTPAEIESIRANPGCVVHPFVPVNDLPRFYRAADIGVWPKQESTSQLDAAACGLPLILNHRVQVRERVDGNGLLYEDGDANDLARQIEILADPVRRKQMGELSAQKMKEQFSWERIARRRVQDYQSALSSGLT